MLRNFDWLLFWIPCVPCILPFSAKCALFFFAMLPLSRDGRAKKKCTKTGEDLKEDKKDGMSGKRMGKKNHCKHM